MSEGRVSSRRRFLKTVRQYAGLVALGCVNKSRICASQGRWLFLADDHVANPERRQAHHELNSHVPRHKVEAAA